MIIEIEGIILTEMPYGETSKIINVLTKEKGIIGIMCKGAKSMKSRLRALTMPFMYAKFYIYYKEGKLSLLKDVDLLDDFRTIHQDILLIAYANYLVELTHQVAKQEYDEEMYDLLLNGLKKIDQKLDPLVVTNIIELNFLKFLGIGLNLDGCVSCNSTNNIITLNADSGGFICKNCYTDEKIVDSKTIKTLRMYSYVDLKNISKINIETNVKYEINAFLNQYYDRYTGLYLKSKKFLNNISEL